MTHLLADWVGLTWIWDVPQSCLGSTAAAVQPNGLWTNSTQPRSARRWVTQYRSCTAHVSLTVENVNCDGGGLCVGRSARVLAAVRGLDGGDEQRGGGPRRGLAPMAARRRRRQHGDPASRRRVVDGLEEHGRREWIMIVSRVHKRTKAAKAVVVVPLIFVFKYPTKLI